MRLIPRFRLRSMLVAVAIAAAAMRWPAACVWGFVFLGGPLIGGVWAWRREGEPIVLWATLAGSAWVPSVGFLVLLWELRADVSLSWLTSGWTVGLLAWMLAFGWSLGVFSGMAVGTVLLLAHKVERSRARRPVPSTASSTPHIPLESPGGEPG